MIKGGLKLARCNTAGTAGRRNRDEYEVAQMYAVLLWDSFNIMVLVGAIERMKATIGCIVYTR